VAKVINGIRFTRLEEAELEAQKHVTLGRSVEIIDAVSGDVIKRL
jgi:hypothetical protein